MDVKSTKVYPHYINKDTKTVYLAGPMRGHELYNFPAFDEARDFLAQKGYRVVSPADLDRATGFHPAFSEFTQEELPKAVRRDVDAILACDMVIVLPNFTGSTGVAAEIALATWLGKPWFVLDIDNNKLTQGAQHVSYTY